VLLALNNWKQSLTNQHRHIRPIYEHNKQLQGVVFTDASLTGWGVTIFRGSDHSHISSGCGRFRLRENIAVLEARALLVGVEAVGEAVQPPGWNFFVGWKNSLPQKGLSKLLTKRFPFIGFNRLQQLLGHVLGSPKYRKCNPRGLIRRGGDCGLSGFMDKYHWHIMSYGFPFNLKRPCF
jgi:hypothetical protein